MKNINLSKICARVLWSTGVVAIAAIAMSSPTAAHADTLYRQLQFGMSGPDVSSLQIFLAEDPSIYPQGLVTGYFGLLTKSAVANFQSRNGLPAVGRVGPATLPVINAQMAAGIGGSNSGGDRSIAIISSVNIDPSNTTTNISWNTSEMASGAVYYDNVPLQMNEHPTSIEIGGNKAFTDSNFHSSQNVNISGLQRNTTYYYMIYATDQAGNVSVTSPSTFRTN